MFGLIKIYCFYINIFVFIKEFPSFHQKDSYLSKTIFRMEIKQKNVKISEKHHNLLKSYCDKKGLKIYKVLLK
jgi:hypothetical protein